MFVAATGSRVIFCCALLFAMFAVQSTAVATFMFDQEYTQSGNGGFFGINLDSSNSSSIGQSFTPTVSELDVVAFFLRDDTLNDTPMGGTFNVELYDATISNLIATTNDVTLPDRFGLGMTINDSDVLFDFPSTVTLSPGTQYVALIRKVSGDMFLAWGDSLDGYSGGRYVGGNIDDDLYFRTGKLVPEPSTGLLLTGGVLGCFALNRRRSLFSWRWRSKKGA